MSLRVVRECYLLRETWVPTAANQYHALSVPYEDLLWEPCPMVYLEVYARNTASSAQTIRLCGYETWGFYQEMTIPANTTNFTVFRTSTPLEHAGLTGDLRIKSGSDWQSGLEIANAKLIFIQDINDIWGGSYTLDGVLMSPFYRPVFHADFNTSLTTYQPVPGSEFFFNEADFPNPDPKPWGFPFFYQIWIKTNNTKYACYALVQYSTDGGLTWNDDTDTEMSVTSDYYYDSRLDFTPVDGYYYRVAIKMSNTKGIATIWGYTMMVTYQGVAWDNTVDGYSNNIPIYGGTGTYEALAQGFKAPSGGGNRVLKYIRASLLRINYPTDNLTCKIYEGSSLASATLIATSNALAYGPCEARNGASYQVVWEFSSPPTIVDDGRQYWAVFERSGSRSTSVYPGFIYDVYTGGYPYGTIYKKDSGTWSEAFPGSDYDLCIWFFDASTRIATQEKATTYFGSLTKPTSSTGLAGQISKYDPADYDEMGVLSIPFGRSDTPHKVFELKLYNNTDSQDFPNSTIRGGGPNGDFYDQVGEYYMPSDDTAYNIYGAGGTNEEMGQSFQLSESRMFSGAILKIAKVGTPTDGLILELASSISGTALATSAPIPAVVLSTTADIYMFRVWIPYELAGSTSYYLRVKRSGARSTSNYFTVRGLSTGGYANGAAYVKDSGSWGSAQTYDLYFEVMREATPIIITAAKEVDVNVLTLASNMLAAGLKIKQKKKIKLLCSAAMSAQSDDVEATKTGGGSSNIKTITGLALANVKTVTGLAIASMKSFNGLQ